MYNVLLAVLLSLAGFGCLSPKYVAPLAPETDHIRLFSEGSWGSDRDIWIFPDDTVRVVEIDSRSRRILTQKSAKVPGAFQDVTNSIRERDAWNLTTASLKAEIQKIEEGGDATAVMDADHDHVEVRAGGRVLRADFYASDSYADQYPTARQVRDFSEIVLAIAGKSVDMVELREL